MNLMLDDWVELCGLESKGEPYRVNSVNKGDTWDDNYITVKDFNERFYVGEYKPIAITGEILQKNGFVKDEVLDTYTYRITNLTSIVYIKESHRLNGIYFSPHDGSMTLTFRCHCYFVHELQQALRLAGFKREIKL